MVRQFILISALMEFPDLKWLKWNDTFKATNQIALCASQLEMLRTSLGDKWPLLCKAGARQAGLAEAKALAKLIIRVASESVDFYATVDFITTSAYLRLEGMRSTNGGRSLIGHLKNSSQLAHEHMVPGNAVLQAVCGLKPDAPVLPMLEALCFRALVSTAKRDGDDSNETDLYLLDRTYGLKSVLPAICSPTLIERGFREVGEVPFHFWPLMRYEAAGLLPNLIPMSGRARELLDAYKLPAL